MIIVDANIILRYLLQDNTELSEKATLIIENNQVFTVTEVIAEVIYVLGKVYAMPRELICDELLLLFNHGLLHHANLTMIVSAITIFKDTKMDFVDCALITYQQIYGYHVQSFDKKLNHYIKNLP